MHRCHMKPYQYTGRGEPRSRVLTHLVHRLAIGYVFEDEGHGFIRAASRAKIERKALEDGGL